MSHPSSPRTISNLVASYPILSLLADYVSALDLFHLALTNRSNHFHILGSQPVFDRLRRTCLCDGRGLTLRQNFAGPYRIRYSRYLQAPKVEQDEPIEVRLYNLKCDETGALPCVRCGVNVCEECRDYPHWPAESFCTFGRPHLNGPCESANVMCLCPPCDAKVEKEVEGKFLNQLCDCNVYTRWICSKCARHQDREASRYYGEHTQWEAGSLSKVLHDHQFDRCFWCTCGATVPDETDPRCIWCKRRHLPQSEWWNEAEALNAGPSGNPFSEPGYPEWVTDDEGNYPTPYPQLGYSRPGEYGLPL